MKRLIPLLGVLLFLGFALRQAGAYTINWNQINPASTTTTAPTPIACGTAAVEVIPPGSILNSGSVNQATFYIGMQIKGGTAGTDGAYCVPANSSGNVVPSPEASVGYGKWFPSGGNMYVETPFNYPLAGGAGILSNRWDCYCTTSLSIMPETLP